MTYRAVRGALSFKVNTLPIFRVLRATGFVDCWPVHFGMFSAVKVIPTPLTFAPMVVAESVSVGFSELTWMAELVARGRSSVAKGGGVRLLVSIDDITPCKLLV